MRRAIETSAQHTTAARGARRRRLGTCRGKGDGRAIRAVIAIGGTLARTAFEWRVVVVHSIGCIGQTDAPLHVSFFVDCCRSNAQVRIVCILTVWLVVQVGLERRAVVLLVPRVSRCVVCQTVFLKYLAIPQDTFAVCIGRSYAGYPKCMMECADQLFHVRWFLKLVLPWRVQRAPVTNNTSHHGRGWTQPVLSVSMFNGNSGSLHINSGETTAYHMMSQQLVGSHLYWGS